MTRDEILATARQCVSEDRNRTYGRADVNFTNVANLWQAYIDAKDGKALMPEDVASMMALFKIARMVANPRHADNSVDGCGYLALAGEISTEHGDG
jgi:hypothetical protein